MTATNDPETGELNRLDVLAIDGEEQTQSEQTEATKEKVFEDAWDNVGPLEKLAVCIENSNVSGKNSTSGPMTTLARCIQFRLTRNVLGNVFVHLVLYFALFGIILFVFWYLEHNGGLESLSRYRIKGTSWGDVATDVENFLGLVFSFYVFGMVQEVMEIRRIFKGVLDQCRKNLQYLYGLPGTEAELALNRKIRMKMSKFFVAAYKCFMEEMTLDEETNIQTLESVLEELLTHEEFQKLRDATNGTYHGAFEILVCWSGKLVRMAIPDKVKDEHRSRPFRAHKSVLDVGHMLTDIKIRVTMLFPLMYTILVELFTIMILCLECFSTAIEAQMAIMANKQGSEIVGLCTRFFMIVFFYVICVEICNELRYPFGTDELDIDNDWFTAAMADSLNTHFKVDIDIELDMASDPAKNKSSISAQKPIAQTEAEISD